MIPHSLENLTVAIDGKTIRSTGKMDSYEEALHIVSAHVAELGLTIGQKTVSGKSNEIPAVRELIELLNIEGCLLVADAIICQKKTAKAIIDGGGDYLLNVKGNQKTLMDGIEDYVQNDELRQSMDKSTTLEPNRGRIERRTAYTSNDVDWIPEKSAWESLACIGAINRKVTEKNVTSNEWHYYISSRNLTADELLKYARNEWSVETMHYILDVHYLEDSCRVEDANTQQNLNMVRKAAMSYIKKFKAKTDSKQSLSKIMLSCLINCFDILKVLRC
jgi:predicted transposase YbfD/YdcC